MSVVGVVTRDTPLCVFEHAREYVLEEGKSL